MKKILTIILFLISLNGFGQIWQPYSQYGLDTKALSARRTFLFPTGCGDPSLYGSSDSALKRAGLYFDSCNNRVWYYNPKTIIWDTIHVGATSGGGSTLQQVLTAGSTLTGNNTIINGSNTLTLTNNSLAGAVGLNITSNSTAAASNAQKLFQVDLSGANANSGQATWAAYLYNHKTGTSSQNTALELLSTSGTTNYGLITTATGSGNRAIFSDGNLQFTNLPTSSDTSTYKPPGIDGSGNLVAMDYWPGGGVGGSNFANADLTFTGNRYHSAAENMLTIDSLNGFYLGFDPGGDLNFYNYLTSVTRFSLSTSSSRVYSPDGNNYPDVTNSKIWFNLNDATDSLGSTVLPYNSSARLVGMAQDSVTGKWYRQTAGGGSGTVTDVSVVSANGFSGSVATSTTTPAITLSINSPSFETWYQQYLAMGASTAGGWISYTNGTGASAVFLTIATAIDAWAQGIKIATGTTAAGNSSYYTTAAGNYAPFVLTPSFRYNTGMRVRFEDLSDVTETYSWYSGFVDEVTSIAGIVDGVYFTYDYNVSSGQFVCNTESNNSITSTASGVTVAADTDYELEISVYNNEALFFINKTLVHTETLTIPSTLARVTSNGCGIIKTAGTTARAAYIEWLAWGKRRN